MKLVRLLFAAVAVAGLTARAEAQSLLFGATASNTPGQLVVLNQATGARLFSINIATGAATAITPAGQVPGTVGGGLAFHPTTGVLYASPLPTNFGTYDPTTGAYTNIAAPSALPAGANSSFTSLDF